MVEAADLGLFVCLFLFPQDSEFEINTSLYLSAENQLSVTLSTSGLKHQLATVIRIVF